MHLKRFPVVARPMTHITRHVNVRQKLHLDPVLPLALTRLTATALHVKAKPSRLVATHLALWQAGKQVTNRVKQIGVCRRIRARRTADWTLVNLNDLIQ